MNNIFVIQKVLGASFIIAGIGKFFRFIEDPFQTLAIGHAANIDSFIEPYSNWVMSNDNFIVILVGMTMLITGIIELFNLKFIISACSIQLLMLSCFITFLHRAIPTIFVIDGLFIVGIAIVIKKQLGLKKAILWTQKKKLPKQPLSCF